MVMPVSTVPYTGHSPTQLSMQLQVTASPSHVLGTHSDNSAPPAMIRQTWPAAHVSPPPLQVTVSPQAPVSTNQVPWVHWAMLRPAPAHERRPQRMASSDPAERRITYGCIVVPVAFYEDVIAPTLGRRRGVVYVLPEHGPMQALLGSADLAMPSP